MLFFQSLEIEEEPHVDERSVDDLLLFINGEDGGTLEKIFSRLLFCEVMFSPLQLFGWHIKIP